jgi:ABC-type transport system substrate-binding protein
MSFNLQDPLIGGTAPANIALRRSIAMAIDDDEYARIIDQGMATPPTLWIPQDISGFDPAYRNPIRYEPDVANALLDRFGFGKGADGFRRRPDGRALTLVVTVGTSSSEREWSELMKRAFDRIAIRVRFDAVEPSEAASRAVHCRYEANGYGGWVFDWPDGSNLMLAFYGHSIGSINQACMRDAEFDAMYERLVATPLGPARAPIYRRLVERVNALTPVRPLPVRDVIYLLAPGVQGLVIHPAPGPNFAPYPYLDVAPKRDAPTR